MLSEEEKKSIDKLKKIREDTIKANECGLSNNDFKEEIEVYNVVLNLITKQQKENEEKDKQIDLMAEYISKRDVEEDICMKNKTNPDWCNEDYTNCQDCIKKYFADLVEKE